MMRLDFAAGVIAKADREHPADTVLRERLRAATGISREDGRAVSEAVFAYYRWLEWLTTNVPIQERISKALELERAFRANPASIPDNELKYAVPRWVPDHVAVSPEWLRTLQQAPKLWLRARPGKGRELAERLGDCWSGGEGLVADAIAYLGAEDLFRSEEFHAGQFELQDISSQAVGWVCDPQPGETWWDACAGEGGKTLHLGDLMKGKGLIWASDRAEWRLQKLKRRAARAGMFNYRSALWDGGAKRPTKGTFNGILVDAPCSGIGTWQRNPHARWTTSVEDVKELGALQKELLANAIPALKPGGRLVYSVCTLAREETTEVAEFVTRTVPGLKRLALKNPLQPDAEAADSVWIWPQAADGNGMFICAWQKAG